MLHRAGLRRPFALQLPGQPSLLVRRQPARLLRPVGEEEEASQTAQHRRPALDHQHPTPTGQPGKIVEVVEDPGAERRSNQIRNRNRSREHGDRGSLLALAEPIGQIDDDAGEEACLRHAQQEAKQVELRARLHEGCQDRHRAPGQQDTRDPNPWTVSVHQDVAWHLEQEVADKEDT